MVHHTTSDQYLLIDIISKQSFHMFKRSRLLKAFIIKVISSGFDFVKNEVDIDERN